MATEAEIYAGLREIFAEVFLRDDIELTPSLTSKQVEGWDSFKQIEIVMSAEELWKFKFTTRELDSLNSVGDLVRVIQSKA